VIRTRVLKNLQFCALWLGIFVPWASAQIPAWRLRPPRKQTRRSGTLPHWRGKRQVGSRTSSRLTPRIPLEMRKPPRNILRQFYKRKESPRSCCRLRQGEAGWWRGLKSSAFADPSKALLLVAHMDVVGVEREKWTVDPFGAVPKAAYIYGRGAIDDKGMLAANLAAFVALKRSNARLNRDVIFLATAGEEGPSDASIRILISKYWDKIAAKYAINEGGNVFAKKRQSCNTWPCRRVKKSR